MPEIEQINNKINYNQIRALADSKSLRLRSSNNKIFKSYEPDGNISKKLYNADIEGLCCVDVVKGCAMLVNSNLFNEVGKFDEKYFPRVVGHSTSFGDAGSTIRKNKIVKCNFIDQFICCNLFRGGMG